MEIQRKARRVQLRILIYILLIFSCSLTNTNAAGTNVTTKECKGIHIRNDLKSFHQLNGCTKINGPLTIALVASNNPKNYENLTFPLLTEVTDYLLFFRVTNLTSLSKLFPNLRVIRGRETVSDYALIIYENLHLQRIDLPNLTDILRGSVRIEGNPSLCYAYTVNWDGICKQPYGRHFIKYNNKQCNDRCPDHCQPWAPWPLNYTLGGLDGDEATEFGAVNNRTLFCWNSQDCHESCVDRDGNNLVKGPNGKCCSPLCAGGCYEGGKSDQCISCRGVLQGKECMSKCDPNLYEYDGTCVDREKCESTQIKPDVSDPCNSSHGSKVFKAVRVEGTNRCQADCPPQFEEDPDNQHKCKACDKGKCRKVCTPPNKEYKVTDVNSLKTLSQCNVIDGSLVIQMKGGKNIVTELEKTFQELEEISGYLTITRTEPILTLNFLRNLKFINGSVIDGRAYAFSIINNPNLQELFTLDKKDSEVQKRLHIRGKLFIQSNPKLCPYKIESLKQYANVDLTEDDISGDNNGDKEACSTDKLEIDLVSSSSRFAMIRIENFTKRLHDARNLLYYLVNYREVLTGNITMFDGRDACGGDVWIQSEETPQHNNNYSNYQDAIIEVKPATRYALYVKTFTIRGAPGALSDMIYFETAPDQPGIPRELRISQTSPGALSISWSPPSQPGGKIVHYTVTIKKVPDVVDLQDVDFCGSIIGRDAITRKISQAEPEQNNYGSLRNSTNATMPSSDSNCNKDKQDAKPDADAHEVRVTFQDTIIDIVYLKNTCPSPSHNQKPKSIKKRSIQHGSTELDNGNSDNSLPRKSINLGQISRSTTTNLRSLIPHTIQFNRSSYKTEEKVNVSHGELSAVITGLDHFSLYEIEVVACHGEFVGTKAKVSASYNKCGLNAITQGRTKAIPEYDKVNASTIIFYPGNETNADRITWDKPQNPNGLALAFRVRYKLKNTNQDVWKEVCIDNLAYERDGGLPLSNILPGLYVLSVQTISMYTDQRLWSDEIEFTIPQTNMLSPLAWTLLIISLIILILMGVAGGAWYSQNKAEALVYASVNPDYVQYHPDEWEVEKSKLNVEAQIGTGSFGTVYKGQLITEKGKRDCAVKTVPPTSTAKQRIDFLREASIMKQFDTFHVVKLLGVVSVTTPIYVIMEYMENGDLKDFLRKQRDVHQKQGKVLVDGIYLMAAQIADGMAYLASKKFVHRDLAARNCMVGENRVVKIGDFGLTRDIYANDYYRRDTQGRLPVRWMAPESLSDNICTSASDVWSYGIVLWEIVTFSASPYQGLSNDEVIKRVIQGYTMPRVEHCTDKLYNIMERCWRKNEKDRPTFLDIVDYLLPETEGKLYPNCYYRKPKADGDSALTIPDDSNNGTESYPLLSWPSSHQANGLTNGDNHVMNHNHHSSDHNGGK